MIITDRSTAQRGKSPDLMKCRDGDKLNIEKFNSLPSPVTARLRGLGDYWIESLCVQTGLMRVDVCGKTDNCEFIDAVLLIDADGNEHNPDDFWLE